MKTLYKVQVKQFDKYFYVALSYGIVLQYQRAKPQTNACYVTLASPQEEPHNVMPCLRRNLALKYTEVCLKISKEKQPTNQENMPHSSTNYRLNFSKFTNTWMTGALVASPADVFLGLAASFFPESVSG